MVLLWFSHDFPTIFLAMACFLRGFRKDPISPPFSQSFRRPWTPSGPPWDPYGTPLGSPWAHLGPPWTPQTTPWAHLGRPLGSPWDPDRETLKKRGLRSNLLGPLFALKNRVFSNAKWSLFFDWFFKHFYLILGMCLDAKNTRNPVQTEKCVFLKISVSRTRELIFQGFEVSEIVWNMLKKQGVKWLTF